MAQRGEAWSDEEDGDDVDDNAFLHIMFPYIADFKKQGDKQFKAKEFQQAAESYSIALHWPIPSNVDFSIIGEHLFRKRAACYFRLGEYNKAIEDSDRAIELAPSREKRKIAESIFIKTKAIVCIGDFVGALPLAVWCKFLRPKSLRAQATLNEVKEILGDAFKKNETLVREVLETVLGLAEVMESDDGTREIAIECYTELIDLLDFLFLHGVLFKRAKCLLKLGRCIEAKEDCEKALWMNPDRSNYLELMHEIMKRLKESESKTAKEKYDSKEKSPMLEAKDKALPEEKILPPEDKKQDIKDSRATTTDAACEAIIKPEKPDAAYQASKSIGSKKKKRKKKREKPKKTVEKREKVSTTDQNVTSHGMDVSSRSDVVSDSDCSVQDTDFAKAYSGSVMDGSRSLKDEDCSNQELSAEECMIPPTSCQTAPDLKSHSRELLLEHFSRIDDKACIKTTDTSQCVRNSAEELQPSSAQSHQSNTKELLSGVSPTPNFLKQCPQRTRNSATYSKPMGTPNGTEIQTTIPSNIQLRGSPVTGASSAMVSPSASPTTDTSVAHRDHLIQIRPNPVRSTETFQRRNRFETELPPRDQNTSRLGASEAQIKNRAQKSKKNDTNNAFLRMSETKTNKEVTFRSSRLDDLDVFPILPQASKRSETDFHSKPPTWNKTPPIFEKLSQPDHSHVNSSSNFHNVNDRLLAQTPITHQLPNAPSPMTAYNYATKINSSSLQKNEELCRTNPIDSFRSTISAGKPPCSNIKSIKAEASTAKQEASEVSSLSPDPRKLPSDVFVLCDHFLQKNNKRSASIFEKTKACKGCENRSKLKYGTWNDNRKEWQIMRSYPENVPLTVAFQLCRQFPTGRKCLKEPCSFAHGKQEQTIWTMDREGILPSPRETLIGSTSRTRPLAQASVPTQPSRQLRYRPPPPGVTDGGYRLCKSLYTHERCRFGRGCLFAHSTEELQEWRQEFEKKEMEKQRREREGRDEVTALEMASQILKGPSGDVTEFLPGIGISSTPGNNVKLTEGKECKWTFTLDYKTEEVGQLRQVLLVHRYHNTYRLREISVGCYQNLRGCNLYKLYFTAKLNDPWYKAPNTNLKGHVKVTLKISFESPLFGSFEQWVLFDFGGRPYLIQKLNADVVGSALLNEQSSAVRNDLASQQWDESSVQVVRFGHGTKAALHNEHLSRFYTLPKEPGNLVSSDRDTETLTSKNYKNVMHQLLFLEELHMKKEISSYLLNGTQLHAQWNIFDEMSGMRCAVDGELFGVLHLQEEDALRPDDAAGRLLYRNVSSVWLQLNNSTSNKVYEAPVEKVESECVVLRLSSKMCTELSLFDTCDVDVNAQFQLNRSPLCQMHAAIDRLTEGQMCLLFPKARPDHSKNEVHIRWQWLLDSRLNMNQKKVIQRIATPEYNALPLVVFGPFGTGKTFTLNQSVRLLVQVDKSHRILLCTHSNRAADNHVELLHIYLTKNNGVPAARPLRVYQPMRRLETASETARKYCLIKDDVFMLPTRDDIVQHRVVVTTLSTSQVLLDLQLFHGFFTHILIDEAAQALEPEMLTPLFFAGPTTKVVLTGDHMQMSPEVYSQQARKWGLHKSLAERLFDYYDKDDYKTHKESNVLFLTENYRCHLDILQFPSDNFYGEKLVARGHASQPAHPSLGPLLFFAARGKETKEQGDSYMNLSEVYEVVKRVKELVDTWPSIWGPRKLSEIAVLSAYRYQVQAIRNNLRKDRELKDVKVDTIHNVQGEEFRALFISTVRTFHTCKPQQDSLYANGSEKQLYWEFLSDPKLLNTAVTRARCLVAVVGDPVSLCTLGECRSLWRDYIKRCSEKGGLFGTKINELEKEINASIASIQLNPEAEPFLPGELLTQSTGSKQEEAKQDHPESVRHQSAYEIQSDHDPSQQHPYTEAVWSQRSLSEDAVQDLPVVESQPPNEDEEIEARFEEDNDFPDYLLEDATVFPRFMDEIIQALVAECEETLNMDATKAKLFADDEFPTLQSVAAKHTKTLPNVKEPQLPAINERVDIKDLLPEVRLVNGRVEVRLVNLGFHRDPSERAARVMVSSKQQDFLDPSVLRRLVQEEPDRYMVCNLRISPETSELAYAEIEDTGTPDIQIKGRIRHAFHKDKVVVELFDKKMQTKGETSVPQAQGKVIGVLEHIISPHERQYVCTTDYENPAVMVPINKSATNLVNLTDKSCKDIPIYRKEQNNKPTKVSMMQREKVLSGKYLFVVKYLCWRRDFSYPLGIVVRALPRGEDLKSSMEIIYAEHGIRRAFMKETSRYVKENFPPNWSIPEEEYSNRTKILNAFTIDPPASKDLDDALSVENTSSSSFQVGVHIADVTFFLECGTPLDHEAFLRCTSYYPGQGHDNVPMLPHELSENYCSLLPEQDRLAVTVFLPLDNEGHIAGEVEIKRTVVRSCCRLDYSEAQLVISGTDVTSTVVPQEVKASIKTLSGLAQKRRKIRLGDSAFDHWQNDDHGNDFEAHELVEEMMILANQEIARFLSANFPEGAPLRIQLPPKDHRMAEWIETHGRYLKFSNQVSRIFNKDESDKVHRTLNLPPNMNFKIQRSVWYEICQAAESRDLPKLHRLICNESNHPQIATANTHFQRIQSESRYVCQGDQPTKNIMHFSLGMRSYTHFTSPMRRYIDVIVHRLVLGFISHKCVEEAIPKDEIAKVCRRSTFSQENARRFDKACKRIQLAARLHQRGHESLSFVESLDKQSLRLHFPSKEDDVLASRQKRVLISHLNPVAIEEELIGEHEEQHITLRWKLRMYKAPDVNDKVTNEGNLLASGVHVEGVADVPSNVWQNLLATVKSGDESRLITLVKETEAQLGILQSSIGRNKASKASQMTPGATYKHPNHDCQSVLESNETEGHFYEKRLRIKKFDYFQVQLTPHMIRGILLPDIQVLKLNSRLSICIEHQRHPRESFAVTARYQASRDRYKTIKDYIEAWKPVLSMEAATQAVKEDGGFTIEGLNLTWKQSDEATLGFFTLPLNYCDSRQLKFYLGDFACVRVPYSETEKVHEVADSAVAENEHGAPIQQPKGSAYFAPGGSASCVWVAHCIIKGVSQVKEKKAVEVILDLHQASSDVPQELFDGNSHRSRFHLIPRPLPHRRMYSTLCSKLRGASKLAHAICKGDEPDQGHFGNSPAADLSVASHHMSCKLRRLDPYQETAVKQALSKPFALIQGPPGTGKTVTGVHIAYWFAKRNRELKLLMPGSFRESQEPKGTKAIKAAPAQVIYCGPSNKSVDVVTEYLLRISGLKLVRVYSDEIERRAFPVPNEVKPARGTRSDDDLKIESDQIKLVSLHHMIRSHDCPYSLDLRQMEEKFAKDKQRGEKTSEEEVSEYCKLIGQAERWVLQESGVQIVLCTCAVAGSPRINLSCDNIQQCIVDECGMCLEPESLIPIACSGARQVILIGDHKQLQPIIQDKVARSLGLNISMFERLSKRAVMLELQYRMHSEICEFPSKHFYEEKLKTADVVKSRDPGPVSFWPAQIRRKKDLPLVFCHVEGLEEAATIGTAESNEESKRNLKEARKAVNVAKYIVNHYRPQVRKSDVVILSPYREQCSRIRELLKGAYEEIQVTTVTKSQGSEWDYVVISLVRSLKKDDLEPEPSLQWLRRQLGFLTDEHQMNVGLTRARKGLCIIGNKHLLGLNPMWQSLLKHYEDKGCIVDDSWPWP